MRRRNQAQLVMAFVLAFASSLAGAQEDPAAARAATFQAVEGPQKDQVPGFPLMVAGYGFVLICVIVYVARLAALQAKNRAELERLSRALDRS